MPFQQWSWTARRAPSAGLSAACAIFYVFLWASAFVPSRIVSVEAQPLWVLVARFACAGGILLAIVKLLRLKLPARPIEWIQICALGFLTNAAYLGLNYVALHRLSSGMGAIIASTNPLVLALAAPYFVGEQLTRRKVAGLLLGFGGVVLVMLARAGSPTERPADALLAFAGVVCFVASTLLYKRIRTSAHLASMTAIQLIAACLALILPALLLEGRPVAVVNTPMVLSFSYLVVVMSIGASFLWFWLLGHGEATRVSTYYFLTPIFGLVLSALILHEPLAMHDAFGLLAIVAGIFIVQRA